MDERGADRFERGRWTVKKFHKCKSDGIHAAYRRHFAYLDDDGEHWDFSERTNIARPHRQFDPWWDDSGEAENDEAEAKKLWDSFPEQNRAWFELFLILPYENVLAIDEKGDEYFANPHVYTSPFHPTNGPFREISRVKLAVPAMWGGGGQARADEAKCLKKFSRKELT